MLAQRTQSAEPIRSEFAADPDFQELLVEFAQALPERRDGLLSSHSEKAYDRLRTGAHQLKGAGGGFGFPQLSKLAAELEQACQSGDPLAIAAALAPVIDCLNRISV